MSRREEVRNRECGVVGYIMQSSQGVGEGRGRGQGIGVGVKYCFLP